MEHAVDDSDIEILTEHLRDLGCDADEIKRIIGRVHQYEKKVLRDSAFDSIEGGTFNISSIIDEVTAQA